MMVLSTVESNRMNELMNILEETEGKAIIWANYQMSVSEIIQQLTKRSLVRNVMYIIMV